MENILNSLQLMYTLPKNKTELSMIIAAERSQAEIKANLIAFNMIMELKARLRLEIAAYSNLSEQQTKDLLKIVDNTFYE